MIFVTVGSVAKFDKLIETIDRLIENGTIKEKVVAQIGNGKYIPKNIEWFRIKPSLEKYYRRADVIISHEGAGTIFELVKMGKKIITLTNPETVDNPDIVIKMSSKKHLLFCQNVNDLEKYIKSVKTFKPAKYKSPLCTIDKKIIQFLKEK